MKERREEEQQKAVGADTSYSGNLHTLLYTLHQHLRKNKWGVKNTTSQQQIPTTTPNSPWQLSPSHYTVVP